MKATCTLVGYSEMDIFACRMTAGSHASGTEEKVYQGLWVLRHCRNRQCLKNLAGVAGTVLLS